MEIDKITVTEYKFAIEKIRRDSFIGKATEDEIWKTICEKDN